MSRGTVSASAVARGLAFLAVLLVVVSSPASAATPARPGFDTNARVSPDGRWIIFDRYFSSANRYSPPLLSLRIVDPEGRAERELVPLSEVSIDAKWTAGNLLHVAPARETPFLMNPEDGTRIGPAVPASAFSPDGRWIAYAKEGELWVSSPDGSNARRVAVASGWIYVGDFSPDSTRLTYSFSLTGETDASEIVAVDGTGRVRLKEAPVIGSGAWAPDSSAVVLMAQNDTGRYRPPMIYVASADGTSVRRLVEGYADLTGVVPPRELDRLRAAGPDSPGGSLLPDARPPRRKRPASGHAGGKRDLAERRPADADKRVAASASGRGSSRSTSFGTPSSG